ncbi:MAG: DnaJ domain-containing protein [Myxococcaceae bacterium]|nr:DnaJ domain-containing protein [Myxococcaceae bacterium]
MSPFDVLGVGRDVDDAGIKRAYAKKVREHPPESDPEGFQRVYEAFELLRDAESRARVRRQAQRPGYEGVEADLLERLNEAEAFIAGGQVDDAVTVLDVVVRRAPHLDAAWESYVDVLDRAGGADAAGPIAMRWARARLSNLDAQLTAARLRTLTFDYDDAREALRVADGLAPHDRRVFFARAELARTREDWDTALKEIAGALSLPGDAPSDLRLRGTRLHIHLERKNVDAARAEVERIDDAALLTELASLAVGYAKPELAAEIFDRARKLDPKRRFTMPLSRTVPHAALKRATQEWVKARLADPPRTALKFLLLMGNVRSPIVTWGAGALVASAASIPLLHGGAALGFVAAFGLLFWGYLKSTEPQFTGFLELRPLHLVHVTFDRVTVMPLFRLRSMTSGGYDVAVHSEAAQAIRVASPDRTELFVAEVLNQRHRLETLGTMDMLDTELDREPLDWE